MAERIGVKWTNDLMLYDSPLVFDDDNDDEDVDDDDQYQYKYLPSNVEIYQAKILGRTVKNFIL